MSLQMPYATRRQIAWKPGGIGRLWGNRSWADWFVQGEESVADVESLKKPYLDGPWD